MKKTKVVTHPTFTVSVTFDNVDAKNPLEAAKMIAKWLKDDADTMIYDIENELSNDKHTVDLSEDDDDAVLPN